MTTPSSAAVAAPPIDLNNGKPAPAPPPNIAPATQLSIGQTDKRFMSNISIEFKGKSATSLRDRITTLFAVLLQADKTIQLHPFDPTTTSPVLSTTAEVPPNDVSDYVSKGKELKNGTKHHVLMSTTLRLSAIKNHTGVMSHLGKHSIWLRPHSIKSHDIINVGFIFRKNCDAHSRHEIHTEMVQALNGKFREFQLIARHPFYKQGITTKAWMLQMDKADSAQWLEPMLKAFPLRTEDIGIQLVPFTSAAQDRNKSMLKVFLYQNKWLREQSVIRVDNLRGLDAPLVETAHPTETTTIRSHFQNLTAEDSTDPLFLSVSQYNSGRVTFLVKNNNYHEATEYVDALIDTYIDNQLDPASKAAITFPGRSPVRIGRSRIPHVIEPTLVQVSALQFPEFEIDLTDDDAISVWSNHRASGSSYASVAATATSSVDSQPSSFPPTKSDNTQLPQKRSAETALTAKQAEIDTLIASIQTKNTALETAQSELEKAVTDLQTSTKTTLQEVHRINEATTRINSTLTTHSEQMTQHNNILNELMLGMNEIRMRLGSNQSSPPRKISRTTDSTAMDGVIPVLSGLDLTAAFQSQARFTPPTAPIPSIPEEPQSTPAPATTDSDSEYLSETDLYSDEVFQSPINDTKIPPEPGNPRRFE